MTTDDSLRKRKPFTPKAALAYFAGLIGLTATVALPVVMVLAESELEAQKARMVTKEKEITRLKSEIRKAAEREQDRRAQDDFATARNTSLNKSGPQVTAMRVPPAESPNTAASFGARTKSNSQVRANTADTRLSSFEAKVSLLYDKVVGRDSPSPDGHSENFHSRLTRLQEKVVQQNARE